MGNSNGMDAAVRTHAGDGNGRPAEDAADGSNSAGHTTGVVEYYILCPQRATEVPGLITHLISRDICEQRQSEHYHKCPNCVRSRVWRERNGLPVEEAVASR